MPKKLLQAVVITFALYLLMGMQSQGTSTSQNSTPQSLSARSLHIVKVIDAVKSLL